VKEKAVEEREDDRPCQMADGAERLIEAREVIEFRNHFLDMP
jgi:hypothetical protein